MFETIEKLLILQDRDKQIRRAKTELDHIEPERQMLKAKAIATQSGMEAAKLKVKTIESRRKDLELEVGSKKQLIDKYANQQLLTRKNEEYRALAHEIEGCKEGIVKIEDQEIELMEQTEAAQKEVVAATKLATEARRLLDDQAGQLNAREENLKKELAKLEANREELASAVDESSRSRYERLMKNKGDNVIVGVEHGVCGGCHMKLPTQIVVTCQAQSELVPCNNCGRILYYTRDMNLAAAD